MSRLVLAAAVFAGSLVAVTPQAPTVPELATTAPKERPKPPRAGRSLERLPLRAVRTPPRPQRQPSHPSLNWPALAQCESSGNPRAVSMGRYFGLYQFDLQTWASVGGTGNPADASPAEQTARAQRLYDERGAAPWPVCGYHLGDAA